MDHLSKQFAFLAELFIDFNESVDDSVVAPAPLPLKRDVGPSYFYNIYNKGSEKTFCYPPYNQPKSSPIKPSAQKIRGLTYLLSEHKFSFRSSKATQSYPNFAPNLKPYFNRGSPSFFPAPVSPLPRFPISFYLSRILLLYRYKKPNKEGAK